jgi:serine/threonine protein phosphatase PrpC
MGIIRSSPDSEIHLKSQKFSDVNYLEASVCGWQHYMEDYTGYARISEKVSVFFVIDGHGGPDLAEITAELIPEILKQSELINLDQYKSAMESLFDTLDDALQKEVNRCSSIRQKHGLPPLFEKKPTSGCSAVIALIG